MILKMSMHLKLCSEWALVVLWNTNFYKRQTTIKAENQMTSSGSVDVILVCQFVVRLSSVFNSFAYEIYCHTYSVYN